MTAAWAAEARADSLVSGTVADAVSGLPIANADIRLAGPGMANVETLSDAAGLFNLSFPTPAGNLAAMTATAEAPNFVKTGMNFQVHGGLPVGTLNFSLLPTDIQGCITSGKDHSVMIGHFSPPIGQDIADLPGRVRDALTDSLLPRLQSANMALELQPLFQACPTAVLQNPTLGGKLAKVLKADAFVSGTVARQPANFRMDTSVSDAFGLFARPVVSTSTGVNLDSPSDARMTDNTVVAILAALAAELRTANQCAEAIKVLSVAESILQPVPDFIASQRKECEAILPNQGLLGATP